MQRLPVSPFFFFFFFPNQHHQDHPENMKLSPLILFHSAFQKLTTLTKASKACLWRHVVQLNTQDLIWSIQSNFTIQPAANLYKLKITSQHSHMHIAFDFYVCSLVSTTMACGTSRICSFCLQLWFQFPLYLWENNAEHKVGLNEQSHHSEVKFTPCHMHSVLKVKIAIVLYMHLKCF